MARASLHHRLLRPQQSNDACLLASQHRCTRPGWAIDGLQLSAYLFLLCPGSFERGSIQRDCPKIAVRLKTCQINDVTLYAFVEHTVFEGVAWAVKQLKQI